MLVRRWREGELSPVVSFHAWFCVYYVVMMYIRPDRIYLEVLLSDWALSGCLNCSWVLCYFRHHSLLFKIKSSKITSHGLSCSKKHDSHRTCFRPSDRFASTHACQKARRRHVMSVRSASPPDTRINEPPRSLLFSTINLFLAYADYRNIEAI
jgi:hypothetical protein